MLKTCLLALLCAARLLSQATTNATSNGSSGFVFTGLLASIPATCTVGQIAFITNSTAGQNIYECTATNVWTQQSSGSVVTGTPPYVSIGGTPYVVLSGLTMPPAIGALTWVNQGTATATSVNGEITLKTITGTATDDVKALVKAVPATPWTFTVGMILTPSGVCAENDGGLYVRESSTGKMLFWGIVQKNNASANTVYRYTAATTFATVGYSGFSPQLRYGLSWFRVTDDGANLLFSFSNDGVNFVQQFSEGRATHMLTGGNQAGIGISQECATSTTFAMFVSWSGI